MKNTIQTHLKDYYSGKNLPDATLERLTAFAEEATVASPGRDRDGQRRLYWAIAVAASLIMGITGALVLTGRYRNDTDSVEVLRLAVAKEVAEGHNKNKPVEFATASYGALGKAMPRLDFLPTEPAMLKPIQLSVQGGRYCSLNGNIAALIKLKNKRGVLCTLYVAKLNDKLRSLGEFTQHFNGLEVRVWQEGDLIFGLAVPLNETADS